MVKFGPIERLGTTWWFELFDLPKHNEAYVEGEIYRVLEDFENKFSRFRDDSLVSKLNKDKAIKNPDPELVSILNLCKRLYEDTDKTFNILVGDYLEMTGYDKDYNFDKKIENLPGIPDLESNLKVSDEEITLGEEARIDLGGIGKGFLIDKLAGIFKEELGLSSFLINGGGDIFATEVDSEGFEVALKNPNEDGYLGKVTLINQGFAGSSPNLRRWKGSDGKTYSHLVGTCESTSEPKSTFVVAPSATEADVWATTLSINPDAKIPEGISAKII